MSHSVVEETWPLGKVRDRRLLSNGEHSLLLRLKASGLSTNDGERVVLGIVLKLPTDWAQLAGALLRGEVDSFSLSSWMVPLCRGRLEGSGGSGVVGTGGEGALLGICNVRKKVMGPLWAWCDTLARPLMMGTPSSRGSGILRAMPTLVPTHKRPLEAIRAVTWTLMPQVLPIRLTLDATLMSCKWRNVSVWYRQMVLLWRREIHRPTPEWAIDWILPLWSCCTLKLRWKKRKMGYDLQLQGQVKKQKYQSFSSGPVENEDAATTCGVQGGTDGQQRYDRLVP